MAKLSEPVKKAFETLLKRCEGDQMVFMRTITGNYNAEDYFRNLVDEIKLLRCAPFNDILAALVESFASSDAIKTTEQPSKAAAVEGILTEEELKERNRLLVLENDELNDENTKLKKYLTICFNCCNSLASVVNGYDFPDGWNVWDVEEARKIIYEENSQDSAIAYERYEVWLAWKSIHSIPLGAW